MQQPFQSGVRSYYGIMVVDMIHDLPYADDHSTKAGGLFGVEKVKPDPWNLAVNTGVGKLMDPLRTIISPRGDFFIHKRCGGTLRS
jgi:hypothetical protein